MQHEFCIAEKLNPKRRPPSDEFHVRDAEDGKMIGSFFRGRAGVSPSVSTWVITIRR